MKGGGIDITDDMDPKIVEFLEICCYLIENSKALYALYRDKKQLIEHNIDFTVGEFIRLDTLIRMELGKFKKLIKEKI